MKEKVKMPSKADRKAKRVTEKIRFEAGIEVANSPTKVRVQEIDFILGCIIQFK